MSRCPLLIECSLAFIDQAPEFFKLFFRTIFLGKSENLPLLFMNVVIDILDQGFHLLLEVLVGRLQARNLS